MFTRTQSLIGESACERLKKSRVIIFGIGGVGSYAAEALARCGIGELTLVDSDTVNETNINRQLIALRSTVGRKKVDVMRERIADINPAARVTALDMFYGADNADAVDFSGYDYVIDAVDTVSAKIIIIERAKAAGVRVISSMGAGNKLHPEMFEISDIGNTSVCPLARVMRRELGKRGICGVKCVYSKEPPVRTGERVPSSISFVPSAAGLILAGAVVRDLIGE